MSLWHALAPPEIAPDAAGDLVARRPLGPSLGVWTDGGFGSPRLDRAEIQRRCPGVAWAILSELLDVFEPTAVSAIEKQSEQRRRRPRRRTEEDGERRSPTRE